jgi:hypothetical protein
LRSVRLQEVDQATWWDTFTKLQRICRKAAQVLFIAKKIDREEMHNYFMSGKNTKSNKLQRPDDFLNIFSSIATNKVIDGGKPGEL